MVYICFVLQHVAQYGIVVTTTESLFYPGYQLSFIPVFHPGLSIRDKYRYSFVPAAIQPGQMPFFTNKKKSDPQLLLSRLQAGSPNPKIYPKLQYQNQDLIHNTISKSRSNS